MGRLTERHGNTYVPNENANYEPMNCMDKLGRLEDLEEQGRLIELPCAVGDTVWRIIEMSTGKTLNRNGATVNPTIKRFIKPVKVTKNNLLDICETYGKKVFSTKEEAEAKLKELEGDKE